MGKRFEDLDVIDDYLVTALATDSEVGARFGKAMIEGLLQRKVGRVKVEAQRVIPGVAPGYRGIRMDVEVEELLEKDGGDTDGPSMNVYDLEPHLQNNIDFPRHNRFYQAKIDSRHMPRGENDFRKLPNLYVITIMNFDYFGGDFMKYTFHNHCEEMPELDYQDGLQFVYFYTGGHKGGNAEVQQFLRYIEESKSQNVTNEAIKELDDCVRMVKTNREVRDSYMTWDMYIEMMKKNERDAGIEEGIKEGIGSGILQERLDIICKKVAKGKKVEQIAEEMELEIEVVESLYEAVIQNPEKSSAELVKCIL